MTNIRYANGSLAGKYVDVVDLYFLRQKTRNHIVRETDIKKTQRHIVKVTEIHSAESSVVSSRYVKGADVR